MFKNAKLFNQPLNNWDVSQVTDMKGMFIKQNLSINVYVSNVINMQDYSMKIKMQFGMQLEDIR